MIGILGGMGTQAGLDFSTKLAKLKDKEVLVGKHKAKIILWSEF